MVKHPVLYLTAIDFEGLSKVIESDQVIVIDVRNHSELEETGKLPRSHCIPCKLLLLFLKWGGYF